MYNYGSNVAGAAKVDPLNFIKMCLSNLSHVRRTFNRCVFITLHGAARFGIHPYPQRFLHYIQKMMLVRTITVCKESF